MHSFAARRSVFHSPGLETSVVRGILLEVAKPEVAARRPPPLLTGAEPNRVVTSDGDREHRGRYRLGDTVLNEEHDSTRPRHRSRSRRERLLTRELLRRVRTMLAGRLGSDARSDANFIAVGSESRGR